MTLRPSTYALLLSAALIAFSGALAWRGEPSAIPFLAGGLLLFVVGCCQREGQG